MFIIILTFISTIFLTGFQTNRQFHSGLAYNPDSRIRFYTNNQGGKYPPSYGWIINDTLVNIRSDVAYKLCNMQTPTYILPGIFRQIQQHPSYLNDFGSSVAKATDGDQGLYLLVNDTKWKFRDGNRSITNATYDYGIDETKIIYTTYSYLNTYRTTYYLQ